MKNSANTRISGDTLNLTMATFIEGIFLFTIIIWREKSAITKGEKESQALW